MESRYQLWKVQPLPKDQTTNEIIDKVDELIKGLNVFYGLVGMERVDMLIVHGYIQDYLKKYPMMKLIDLDRSIELYKKRPELNKLCPEYFETMFEKYRKSDERKQIYKDWENDPEQHRNELPEHKKEYDANELLQICFNNWKQTKIILLNTGLVYTKNYLLLESALGLEKMNELKEQTRLRLITEFEGTIAKYPLTNSNLADEAKRQLDMIKKGEGLVKSETRKAHLNFYFEMLVFETA